MVVLGHDREEQPVRVLETAWRRPLWMHLPVRFRTMRKVYTVAPRSFELLGTGEIGTN